MTIWDDYPFPLESGDEGWLRLPRGKFTAMDAKRLGAIATVLTRESLEGAGVPSPSCPPVPDGPGGAVPSKEPAAYLEDLEVQERIERERRTNEMLEREWGTG